MYLTFSMVPSLLFVLLLSSSLAQPPRIGNSPDRDFLLPLGAPSPRVCMLESRTFTGQCTSRFDSTFGEARLPQFSYQSVSSIIPSGGNLKSAREISNIIFSQTTSIPNARGLNQLLVFFGQFLDHNYAATPEDEEDPFDIPVSEDDPSISEDHLEFARSVRGPVPGGERPINILSSAVDLVAVYGPNVLRNEELRERDSTGAFTCKLKTSGDRLLPLNVNGFFNSPDETDMFFLAGDHRSNEHPALTAFHTIFLREHNRLADVVEQKFPLKSTEECYELARAMNIAQFQKIVFEEFYPAMVGESLGRFTAHRPTVDLTLSDVFAGAAFRIGHTMVGETLPTMTSAGVTGEVPIQALFFRKADTFNGGLMNDILRGLASTRAQEVDGFVVDTLRDGLFEFVPNVPGFDLVALNIQRGRDHVLPTFQEIRQIFGLSLITDVSDITSDPVMQGRLEEAYASVDDIEAFPGLMAEDNAPGASMGETMIEVWKAEFTRLRDGDQFYFENADVFPNELRIECPEFLDSLEQSNSDLMREIILRNTDIDDSQLPNSAFFV